MLSPSVPHLHYRFHLNSLDHWHGQSPVPVKLMRRHRMGLFRKWTTRPIYGLYYYSSFLLFFTPRGITDLVETHLETNLRSSQDSWKNFRRPSKFEIRSLNHPFEGPIRELLIHLKLVFMAYILSTWAGIHNFHLNL